MRLIVLSVIAMSSLLHDVRAQEQTTYRPHSLDAGSWAVLYQVDGVRLTFYDGMLALKYHLAPGRALRFGLGGNASASDANDELRGGISGRGCQVFCVTSRWLG